MFVPLNLSALRLMNSTSVRYHASERQGKLRGFSLKKTCVPARFAKFLATDSSTDNAEERNELPVCTPMDGENDVGKVFLISVRAQAFLLWYVRAVNKHGGSKAIEEAEKILDEEDDNSKCILVNRPKDNRIQLAAHKYQINLAVAKFFITSSASTVLQLDSTKNCEYPLSKHRPLVCVNPFHIIVDRNREAVKCIIEQKERAETPVSPSLSGCSASPRPENFPLWSITKSSSQLPDILFDPLSELDNCEVLPLSSLPEQQILDDGMQKSSTDTDGFMGMGNLMDQIVHDGVMDINRLDNILFSPPSDAVSTSANDGGVSSSNTDWMADAPLPPDPLPGDLLMSEPVSYPQHQYPAMMREASFNCRYGAVHRGGRPINYQQYAPQHVQGQYVQMQQHLPVGHVQLQQQRIQQFPQSSHNINHHIQERYRTLPTESRHTASSSFASTYTQLQPSTARPQTLHAHGQSQLHMNTPRQSQQKIGPSSITTPQGQQHYGQSMQQPTVPSQDRMSPGSNIRTVPQVTQVADESNTHRNTVHVIPSADTQARISNAEGADFIPNEWALILLYEFRDRVGQPFKSASSTITVDGFCSTTDPSRFCLGSVGNGSRQEGAIAVRSQIGKGIQISFENGRAHLTCLGESPVFVQSPLHAGRFGDDPATVYRLSGAQDANLECRTMEIFDETAFNLRIDQAKLQGYRHVYALQSLCIIRVSFVKGFGKLYRRMRILDTPCWIEVHFVNYLQKLDRVLSTLQSPSDDVSSFS